jgi:hypothetical protein
MRGMCAHWLGGRAVASRCWRRVEGGCAATERPLEIFKRYIYNTLKASRKRKSKKEELKKTQNPTLTKIQEKLHEIKHNQGYIILELAE